MVYTSDMTCTVTVSKHGSLSGLRADICHHFSVERELLSVGIQYGWMDGLLFLPIAVIMTLHMTMVGYQPLYTILYPLIIYNHKVIK